MDGRPEGARAPIDATWLGRVAYRDAWDLQKRLAADRAEGAIGDRLLLLEHDAVLTLGRGADEGHVLASPDELDALGIELLRVERGGEVTYHGPGQLVAYPIVRLADRGLLVRPFVRALEAAMIETCAAFGVAAGRREGHPGCWVDADGTRAAQDRRARAAGRARDDLPRHRAQRGRRARRASASSTRAGCPASCPRRSPPSSAGRTRRPSTARVAGGRVAPSRGVRPMRSARSCASRSPGAARMTGAARP